MDKTKTPPKVLKAYYLSPINGGYQLHELTIEDDIVSADVAVENPDAWPEVIGYLDNALAKQFPA